MSDFLSTNSYKGVRDFFPEDAAIQQYIFDTWAKTAESFGFARYDASILEPAELYKAKGAENEEMVNEQTYTFTDRGGREVTLRPEMTPTVARMIAAAHQRRELTFPARWYSIPNLFRYERTQRGRLREHWQLNCDIFGVDDIAADIEIIALAHQLLVNFGADESMFEIRVNNRLTMKKAYELLGITDELTVTQITRLNDKKHKVTEAEYVETLSEIVSDSNLATEIKQMIEQPDSGDNAVIAGLRELGIINVTLDRSLARGFDYYTGTIFEIFDKHPDGSKRSMLGGGRYDNLTSLFGGEPISGIGFGMGDVTMRDFLETHNLLPESVRSTAPTLMIIPMTPTENLPAQKLASEFRQHDIAVAVDFSTRKIGKKLATAAEHGTRYVLVMGEDEVAGTQPLTLKELATGTEVTGTLIDLLNEL